MRGPVALVGSGEYLHAMDETDQLLLDYIGGPAQARVALLPTASGREKGRPHYWNALGLEHFHSLDVADVRATMIIDAESARDPVQVDLLRGANFFYFSGGDPQQIIASMRDSPAWEIIMHAYAQGAVLAGCSAGAMALSGRTFVPQRIFGWQGPPTVPALGIVPQVLVLPHFDRMRLRWHGAGSYAGQGEYILGVDEDTAIVRLAEGEPWRITGRQTVTVMRTDQPDLVLHRGDTIDLGSST
jgi:cyanophycinase